MAFHWFSFVKIIKQKSKPSNFKDMTTMYKKSREGNLHESSVSLLGVHDVQNSWRVSCREVQPMLQVTLIVEKKKSQNIHTTSQLSKLMSSYNSPNPFSWSLYRHYCILKLPSFLHFVWHVNFVSFRSTTYSNPNILIVQCSVWKSIQWLSRVIVRTTYIKIYIYSVYT